jgi:hypothetical protein
MLESAELLNNLPSFIPLFPTHLFLIHLHIPSFTHSLFYSFTPLFTYSVTHSLSHSFTQEFPRVEPCHPPLHRLPSSLIVLCSCVQTVLFYWIIVQLSNCCLVVFLLISLFANLSIANLSYWYIVLLSRCLFCCSTGLSFYYYILLLWVLKFRNWRSWSRSRSRSRSEGEGENSASGGGGGRC